MFTVGMLRRQSFFLKMLENQVLATEVTYSCVLCASASLAALELGTQIHSLTVKTNYAKNTVVHNALIDINTQVWKDQRCPFSV